MQISLLDILNEIPVLSPTANYWLVRADGGKYYDDFRTGDYIGINWDHIGETEISDAEDDSTMLKIKVSEKYPDDNFPGSSASQILKFKNDIKLDDIVVVPSRSSEIYLVGKIISELYFEQDGDLLDPDIHCPFIKRKKVSWYGSFSRSKADPALFKLVYAQHTITNINDSKPFINRALFDTYIEGDEIHLTYGINIPDNIDMKALGEFMYKYSLLFELLFPGEKIDIKINAQSIGKMEIISKAVGGLTICTLLFGLASLPYGADVSVSNPIAGEVTVHTPGIITERWRIERERRELENASNQSEAEVGAQEAETAAQELENMEKAIQLATELDIPISALSLTLPKETIDAIQKAQEKQEEASGGSPEAE